MFVAGIDENGLGPKLGPLVATGALFDVGAGGYVPRAFERAFERIRRGGAARVADSKAVMASRDMAAGETTVLALSALLAGTDSPVAIPASCGAFLDLVCGPGHADLRSGCPPAAAPLCFGEDEDLPLFGGDRRESEALALSVRDSLAEEGIRLAAVECEVVCAGRFNEAFRRDPGLSKADFDLGLFENRIVSLSRRARGEALFLCGKVMNLANYAPRLQLVRGYPLLQRSDGREESRYRLQDLGEVRFILDGDSKHAPVSLASMFGKYVREIFVSRLNRFFSRLLPALRPASGYGDPATDELIRRALPVLETAGVPAECFLRRR